MGESPQPLRPGRPLRRLATLLAAAAGGVILISRLSVSERAPGETAGGAVTAVERCSRSMPVDLAQACIAELQKKDAAARRRLWAGTTLGGVLLGLALWAELSARRQGTDRRAA
jgi:hypothetical protein